MNAIKTMWAVVWSIPAAILWMLLYAVIFVGWGTKKSDDFVLCWNAFVDEGDFRFPDGNSG
jgi:hypothetical protein